MIPVKTCYFRAPLTSFGPGRGDPQVACVSPSTDFSNAERDREAETCTQYRFVADFVVEQCAKSSALP